MTILLQGSDTIPFHLFRPLQNCHPDRSEAQWRDLLFLLRPGGAALEGRSRELFAKHFPMKH
jgi:hypothetical protein